MIILDTNVLSELMRPAPAERVVRWIAARPAVALFTTTVTEGELHYGVELLPVGKRRLQLEVALRAIFEEDLAARVLPFDSAAARVFGQIASARRQAGRPISHADAQIAAIARSRGAEIATRNVADFEGCDVRVLDPWSGDP